VIDIHFHCLPAVDDGPRSWDDAVALCRAAAAEGAGQIVATPHVLRGLWPETERAKRTALVAELNQRLGGTPLILEGCEYYFGHDMAELLATQGPIVPLGGGRYVLVEFSAHALPPLVDSVFYRAQLDGWTPVIAHPERHAVFQARPEALDALVTRGAKVQLTAGSLTGHFGETARRTAISCLERGAVHFVASDAHSLEKRPPRLAEAWDAVVALAGAETAEAVFKINPKAVVEGLSLPWDPEIVAIPRPSGWFSRLRTFFS
jgi:protein-tyrosine phosphatase